MLDPSINVHSREILVGGHIHGSVNSYNTVHYNSEPQRVTLANWVTTLDFSQDQAQAFQKYTEGTLLWILEEPQFVDWLRNGGMLWLPGKPGAGKTVLASFIIDHLQRLETKPAVCYIYCRYDSTRTTVQVFEAILRQVILRCPTASVERVQEAKDRSQRLALKDILSILQQTFDLVQNIFIVVDALDECFDENTRNEVLHHLHSLSCIPILTTSRPLPIIEAGMSKAAKLILSAHNEDVQTHFRAQKKTDPTLAKLASNVPEAEEKVIDKADGSFLLARLHMTHLAEQTNTKQLRLALETLPDEAATVYEGTLERIRKQSPGRQRLAFHAFSWILYAMRTLKLIELRHALAIGDLNRMATDDELDDEELIISSCAGLIELNKESQTVTFIHYTVKEFLQEASPAEDFLSEVMVATACLKVISFPEIESDPPNYPLIDYAISFWGPLVSKYEHEEVVVNLAVSQLAKGTTDIIPIPGLVRAFGRWRPRSPSALDLLALYSLVRTGAVLIQRHGQIVSSLVDTNAYGALILAIQFGNVDCVKLLLELIQENDIELNPGSGVSCATVYGHLEIVKLLLSQPNMDANTRDIKESIALNRAAIRGDQKIVELLLCQRNIDVNMKNNRKDSPLSSATRRGHLEVVKMLLTHPNTDANSKGYRERTPLSYAAQKGHSEIVEWLLTLPNIDVNSKDDEKRTSLSYAAEKGHLEIVKSLLTHPNIDVNWKDSKERTPLSYAAQMGHLEMVRLLLAYPNIDANPTDNRNKTPLSYAKRNGHSEIAKLLLIHSTITVNPTDHIDDTAGQNEHPEIATLTRGKEPTTLFRRLHPSQLVRAALRSYQALSSTFGR